MSADDDRDLLKEALLKIRSLKAELSARQQAASEPIAIVGIGCRFPGGADSPDAYWRLLRDGVDAITQIPAGRWDREAYYHPNADTPGTAYVREGGFLDDAVVRGFDADFFGIAPREAARLDPQQRLLLEVAWEALEHAGITPRQLAGRDGTRDGARDAARTTGVYIGAMSADYGHRQAHHLQPRDIDPYMLTGNDLSFAAGRLSYFLGLHGPAMVVSTACSSSLVSVHLAMQAIRGGECDVALAGGVNVVLDPTTNVMLSKLRALSKDGRCKTFDARADGYGRGEGCGIIVLERLSQAIAERHRILAVIRGSAVNHDGPSAGLTVPNGSAQEDLLRRAFAAARIAPADLDYVEAHGTGTALGDPIELNALARAIGPRARERALKIGSVKTNIGHLEPAAGIASLIKVVLALQHRQLPPHLHFQTPSPHVDWNTLPIEVVTRLHEWRAATDRPRLAGVSSFGLSGVNAHIVIEESPDTRAPAATASPTPHTLTISARTPEALDQLIARYDTWLAENPNLPWADVCFTAAVGRTPFAHRIRIVAAGASEARARLQAGRDRQATGASDAEVERVAAEAEAVQTQDRQRISLPTYPFQRQTCWALDDAPPPIAAESAAVGDPNAVPKANALRVPLAAASAEQRRALTLDVLEHETRIVLGLPAGAAIDRERSLLSLGLDSLMSVELRDRVRARLDVEPALEQLLSGATLAEVGATLIDQLQGRADDSAPADAELADVGPRSSAADDSALMLRKDLAATAGAQADGAAVETVALSYGQKALWFIHQSHPASAAYNVGVALRLEGAVDHQRLRQGFQRLVDRHASLRSVFAIDGDEPSQRILAVGAQAVSFSVIDADGWSEERLSARVHEDYRRPFDLERGPLLRVSLYRGSAAHGHVLLLAMHHIVCDAQSCWTLLEELQALYAAESAVTGVGPGEAYAGFVAWQREWVGSAEGRRQEEFWRRQLAGELPVLDLPVDRQRAAVPAYSGASHAAVVPVALAAGIRALARGQDATLYATLLAAFHVLLHRYTGQDDIAIGSATSGRPRQFSSTVGYFVNPVVMRADLSGNPTFAAFLQQVRKTAAEAIAHQHLPFPLLVERLRPRRDARQAPLFQADFSLAQMPRTLTQHQQQHQQQQQTRPLVWSRFDLAEEEGQFDIGLHVSDEDDRLRIVFKYDTDLFEPATIEGMSASFLALLDAIAANPDERIDALRLLPAPARQRLLAMGVGPRVPEPPPFVHRLFEQQVARTPEAIAVEMWNGTTDASQTEQTRQTLTYRELDARAERLAAVLRGRGVRPDQLVGVCLRPSVDLVIALLAVLKAGGAYVPLDPTYPADRLAFMVRDAGMRTLITARALLERLPELQPNLDLAGVSPIWIEDEYGHEHAAASKPPAATAAAAAALTLDHLAYVIYTSGSTGQPKGAMITHRGLGNYLSWCLDAYRLQDGCGAPVNSSIAFDATITSFFAPLLAGGTVTLLPDDEVIDSLATVLRGDRTFSLVKITPAHLDVLAQQLADHPVPAARVNAFVIGGEALRGDSLRFWQSKSPGTRLINEYGPTETVVGCCVHDATPDSIAGAVPIGRPIANTELYVLDPRREPVPIGVIGELYIGGAGVARGYVNRPELTAARFIDDPFSNTPGARLYRTGDLARWRRDGVLEYVGRIDTQVKIRGFRIEPGEIEAVLSAHSAIADSLVIARDIAGIGKQLVAYVVATAGDPLEPRELRRHLASRLPEHMIPAAFVPLAAFPLTPNGKVDRAALPAPAAGLPTSDRREATVPRDALEMSLAAIWEELLGVSAIDIHDSFFDLGGHSLLAVRLMARITRELGYHAPLAAILRAPTIAQLARQLRLVASANATNDDNTAAGDSATDRDSRGRDDRRRGGIIGSRSALVPIHTGGSRPPFFCVPGAGGNPIYLQNLARHLGSEQPFYALQGAGVDDEARPHGTVEEMAAYYLDAIASIAPPEAGYQLVGHSLGGWVAFEMARQLRRRGHQVPLVAIIDTPAPFVTETHDRLAWDDARWIAELAERIAKLLAPDMQLTEEALRTTARECGPEAAFGLFRDTLVAAGAFPPEGDIVSLRRTLDVFKAHSQVAYSVNEPAPIERLVLLRTNAPPSQIPWPSDDETWGWGRLAPTEVCCVPGDHLAVLRPPHVAALAERLAACAATTPTRGLAMTSV